jgi:hypothetical protein
VVSLPSFVHAQAGNAHPDWGLCHVKFPFACARRAIWPNL